MHKANKCIDKNKTNSDDLFRLNQYREPVFYHQKGWFLGVFEVSLAFLF